MGTTSCNIKKLHLTTKGIIAPRNIIAVYNRLVFLGDTDCPFCAVITEGLHVILKSVHCLR